jgi:hypothetical protein
MVDLGICESFLLALTALKIIRAKGTRAEKHEAVAVLMQRILAGKDGVWH